MKLDGIPDDLATNASSTVKDSALEKIYNRIRKELDTIRVDNTPDPTLLLDEKFLERTTMPYWSSEDTRAALVSTLIPGGAALLGTTVYTSDPQCARWWSELRKPKWLTPNSSLAFSLVDLATVTPLGYASYLCYKHGGGFDYTDTRIALALYTANIGSVLACIPLVKKRNLDGLCKNMFLVHGTALATAIAFFQIHKPAAYWYIPYALWSGFYLIFVSVVAGLLKPRENSEETEQQNEEKKENEEEDMAKEVFNRGLDVDMKDAWDDTELIRMYEDSVSSAYKQLNDATKKTTGKKDASKGEGGGAKTGKWSVGDRCLAPFDDQWYPATITRLEGSDQVEVRFDFWENIEVIDVAEIFSENTVFEETEDNKPTTSKKVTVKEEESPAVSTSRKRNTATSNAGKGFQAPIPSLAPPPPPAFSSLPRPSDDEALSSMLMSWYMSGYHTGYYQALRDIREGKQ